VAKIHLLLMIERLLTALYIDMQNLKKSLQVIFIGERDRNPDKPGKAPQCPMDCKGCSWCYPGYYGAMSLSQQLRKHLPNREIDWMMVPVGSKDSRNWLNQNPGSKGERFLSGLTKEL
jgi:hypothetical protein